MELERHEILEIIKALGDSPLALRMARLKFSHNYRIKPHKTTAMTTIEGDDGLRHFVKWSDIKERVYSYCGGQSDKQVQTAYITSEEELNNLYNNSVNGDDTEFCRECLEVYLYPF